MYMHVKTVCTVDWPLSFWRPSFLQATSLYRWLLLLLQCQVWVLISQKLNVASYCTLHFKCGDAWVCVRVNSCALCLHQCRQEAGTRECQVLYSQAHICASLACFYQQVEFITCPHCCQDPWEKLCWNTLRTVKHSWDVDRWKAQYLEVVGKLSRIQIWKISYLTTDFPWKSVPWSTWSQGMCSSPFPDGRKGRTHAASAVLEAGHIPFLWLSACSLLPYPFSVLSFSSLFPPDCLEESLMN